MPNKNSTGPNGKGPLTGRGSGHCIIPLSTTKEELDYLKNQEKVLKQQLLEVKNRIRTLETATTGGTR
jgi:hypothetical protein